MEQFVSAYSDHLRVDLICGPSRTRQSFQDECDVNLIVERFAVAGELPVASEQGFGDVSEVPDFAGSMDVVLRGQRMFDELPASWRRVFAGDARRFVEFIDKIPVDSGAYDVAVELGLISRSSVPSGTAQPASAKDAEEKPAVPA